MNMQTDRNWKILERREKIGGEKQTDICRTKEILMKEPFQTVNYFWNTPHPESTPQNWQKAWILYFSFIKPVECVKYVVNTYNPYYTHAHTLLCLIIENNPSNIWTSIFSVHFQVNKNSIRILTYRYKLFGFEYLIHKIFVWRVSHLETNWNRFS